MKFGKKIHVVLLLSAIFLLLPTYTFAQGKGRDKDDDDDRNAKIKVKSKGDKLKIDIKVEDDKKGKGDKPKGHDYVGKGGGKHKGHGHYGHPGRGYAYGKYKWSPSKDAKHARIRYRDQLKITVSLVRGIDVFLVNGRDRHKKNQAKFDLSLKKGKLDIKVRERRAARLKLIDIKIKELDAFNGKAKVKLKIS